MTFTYDESIVSDLFKDAFGFRPRDNFWQDWNSASQQGKQEIWDGLCKTLEYEMEAEKRREDEAIAAFEYSLADVSSIMNCDRRSAIRIFVQSLELSDVDLCYGGGYICHRLGLPYRMAQGFVDAGAVDSVG